MILGFVLLFVILILIVQQWTLENSLDAVEGNFWPKDNVVDPDETFDVSIELKNKKRLPLYYIKVQCLFVKEFVIDSKVKKVTKNRSIDGHTVTISTWLKPRQKAQLKVPVSASCRGRYVLVHPSLYCGDFLGLKECKKNMEQMREVVVAPKEYDSQEVKQVLGKFLGDYSVRRFIHEDPVLTLGFREYTGREPLKTISWKQSAQRQMLMVKEYDHTVEPVISVLVNVETELADNKELLEKCFSLARSVCSNLEARGMQYDFYTNAQMAGGTGDDYTVSEGLGPRHFTRVMELLGRSMHISAFSLEKLMKMAEDSGGKDRGKIIITPNESPVSSADGQILVLKAHLL